MAGRSYAASELAKSRISLREVKRLQQSVTLTANRGFVSQMTHLEDRTGEF